VAAPCSAGVVCEALSFITHSSKAATQGRIIASKLKENLSRQQFEIVLQAKVGNKVLHLSFPLSLSIGLTPPSLDLVSGTIGAVSQRCS
jgi:hypothetical protein